MRKTSKYILLVTSAFVIVSCGENKEVKEETFESSEIIKEELIEEEPELQIFGTYEMTDMIPFTDGKKLTSQDEKYIKESKDRTIGKTTLILNDDGTFSREFPHPSNDGSMSKWTGTFDLNEEEGTLVMNAEMNGKTMPINFSIEDNTGEKLSLKTDFGQIYMIYVYSKK